LFVFTEISSQNNQTKKVLISTNYGDIKIELYNETPLHRDNFLKLAREGFFDGLLFHRVINNFMIQGGDPDSHGAEPGKRLGSGGPGYQIPAEINPKFFHKKGALAAARSGDQVNPERKSSGSQFYIVKGTVQTQAQLDTMEIKMNYSLQQSIQRTYYTNAQEELNKLRQANDQAGFNKRVSQLKATADSAFRVASKVRIPDEKRKAYTTIGGYPSLDGSYTVFGQVLEGLDIIDKISSVKTDGNDRPLVDVIMKIKVLE
jgi:cyclophilin family peptidyl-prolyl cis-trans isomerase